MTLTTLFDDLLNRQGVEEPDGRRLFEYRCEDAGRELRELLLGILRAYEEQGEGELAKPKLGSYLTARYGGVGESRGRLGDLSAVRTAFRRMQTSLYAN